MALTELQVKNAKPKEKRYMLADGECLYIEVLPSGKKSWRMRHFADGGEKLLTLGGYPDFSLKEARDMRNDARERASLGEAPFTMKQRNGAKEATFAELFKEYMDKKVLPKMSRARIKGIQGKMNCHALNRIGDMPVGEIDEVVLLDVIRAIETQGKIETAHSVRGICGQIFRYGIATGKCGRDPSAALKGALQPKVVQHRARVQGKGEIGGLMRSIGEYKGFIIRNALLFQAYALLRPGETCSVEWGEVGLQEKTIRIPAEKMKMRKEHIVPLPSQAVSLLEGLKPVTGHGGYVFPCHRTPNGSRHVSTEAMLAAIRRMGYAKDEMSVHGFRGIAATELYESGKWSGDAIERQLAHVEGNSVKAAYSYAQHLDERREMMQWWADYLDELKGQGS
jgi:integrase